MQFAFDTIFTRFDNTLIICWKLEPNLNCYPNRLSASCARLHYINTLNAHSFDDTQKEFLLYDKEAEN